MQACAGVCGCVCVLIGGVAVCVRGVAVWCVLAVWVGWLTSFARLVAPYLFFSSGGVRCVPLWCMPLFSLSVSLGGVVCSVCRYGYRYVVLVFPPLFPPLSRLSYLLV